MTDWIEPKTLLTPDNKQRALVDYIVKNDLLYLKDNASNGDMQTATYDTDVDGVVDKAEGVVTGTVLPDTGSDGELFGKTDSKELYIWFD